MEANPCDQRYYELLEQLQTLDFALVELNLYLNTHPDDLRSIEQFNQLTQERTKLANQFQELYGPLQILAEPIRNVRGNGIRRLGLGRCKKSATVRN